MSVSATSQAFGSDAFLKLFIEQLKHQDPMQPMDPSELTAQLAQLTSVESLASLNDKFDSILAMEQLSAAKDLIGCDVTYTDPNAQQPANGIVSEAAFSDGEPGVLVGERFVPLTAILGVRAEAAV